jgi:hypothetical protein
MEFDPIVVVCLKDKQTTDWYVFPLWVNLIRSDGYLVSNIMRFVKKIGSSSLAMLTVKAILVLLLCIPPVFANWVHVTCQSHYEFSASDTELSCSDFDLLEDGRGYFISVFATAEANRETGRLSVASGGGSIRDIGFDGGDSKAYLRKTFAVNGEWLGWLPVTVNVELTYLFVGFGEAQLNANLWTYESTQLISDNQMSLVLRYDGFEHANLFHSRTVGSVELPEEGAYKQRATFNLTAIQKVHHTAPTLDVRIDLLAWSAPSLGTLGSKISASVEADAKFKISIPNGPSVALMQ